MNPFALFSHHFVVLSTFQALFLEKSYIIKSINSKIAIYEANGASVSQNINIDVYIIQRFRKYFSIRSL